MMKSFLLAGAMIVAAPALAQTNTAPTNPNAATPATPATPAQNGQAAQPATPAEASPQAQSGAANASDAVAQVVAADWNTYDADKNGALSKEEFAKWMIALREKSPQQQPVADINAWTNAAFAQADKDKSSTVTQTELQTFLRG